MNWNQPICDPCWFDEDTRQPVRVRAARLEKCAMCGDVTMSGIYVRRHPSETRFPAGEDE